MMTKKSINFKSGLAIAAICLVSLSACRKEKDEASADNDTSTSIENAVADAAYNDVANIADQAYTGSVSTYRSAGDEGILFSCASVSFDTLSTPKSFTVDFGTSNCLGNDGNYRRGKIIVTYTGAYRDSGSSHTITFDSYYVNDNNIAGSKTVTNTGRNNAGHLTYSISINGSITWDPQTFGGGGTSTYTANRTREWSEGESTQIWADDVYLISGTSSGTTRTGASYTANTVSPLKKYINFRYITDGTLAFTPSGKYTRYINFGYSNAAKDNLAQVTINGYTFVVQLK